MFRVPRSCRAQEKYETEVVSTPRRFYCIYALRRNYAVAKEILVNKYCAKANGLGETQARLQGFVFI